MNAEYVRTVQLMLDVAPAVFANPSFAMKGGTAINLFLQDMPRLSVDIDVVFTRYDTGRDDALKAIAEALGAVRQRVESMGYRASQPKSAAGDEAKLFIQADDIEVKIEVNHVFRGTVLPVQKAALTAAAQQRFSANIELPVLAPTELYVLTPTEN